MAGIDRIESAFNIPAIQAEFDAWRTGLAESKDALLDLYNTTKQFKDTSLTNLTANTVKLNAAINASVQNTGKAKLSFDELSKKISEQVQNVNENISALNKNSAAYDQLIKQAVRNKIANDELSSSATALRKSYESGKVTFEQYENTLADIKEAQQSIKTSNADVTKTLNSLEKQAQSSSGSLDNMRARLNELVQSYDKLNATERESEGGQGLQATIQATNKAVTELEVSTGRSQRKVGDYVGALSTLEEMLAEVNAKLAAMSAAGEQNTEVFAQTASQAEQLTTIIGTQEKGFSSITQQTRSLERALQTLNAAGLAGSEGFDKLRESVVEAAQEQKEFSRQQKLLESEAPVLGAITLAAKGLAGAYAVGAGSVALFAEGNEKVEKELNKLVAIMTILQGLQEAYELINKSGSVATAIRLGLQKATNSIMGEQVVLNKAAVVTNTELAISETEVAAASETQAAALSEVTLAAEAATVAETETTVATATLGRALITTGIGAAIAFIAVAIAYVISKIPDWIKGNTITIKQQGEISEAVKKANEALIEQAKTLTDLDSVSKRYYENQLGMATAAGANAYKQAAIRKQIGEEEKQLAQDQIDLLGANNKQQSDLKSTIDDLNLKRKESIRIQQQILAIPEQNQTSDQKDQLIAATKNAELYGKQIESISGLYEAGKKAREDLFNANQKDAEEEIKIAKFSADEQRKLTEETIKLQVEAAKDRNSRILSDEKSTLDQRLSAIKNNSAQEARAANATYNALDPNATDAERRKAQLQRQATINKANADATQDTLEEEQKFYQRRRDATMEQAQDLLEDQIKINDSILEKDKSTQAQRLAIIADSYNKQRAIVGAQLLKMLDDPKLKALDKVGAPNPERLAAIAKYNSDILALNIGFGNKQEEEQKKEQDRQLKQAEAFYDKQKEAITVSHAEQLKALNEKNNSTAFGSFGYDENKKKIDEKSKEDELRGQIDQDQRLLAATKIGSKERADAEAKIEADSLALSELITNKKISDQEKLAQATEKLGYEAQDLVKTSIDARYENELNHIQKLIDHNEKLKETELARITSSTRSEQEKAAAIAILTARTDAQNEILARKARKLKHDEAVVDKAFNVAKAIEEGIVATLKALGDGGPVLAAVVGAISAIEVAKIIATPIPAYKAGTGDHPGGLAKVGDGGVPELIQEPGKAPYWSPATSTIMDLLPHTKVTPPSEIERMLHAGLFVNHVGVMKSQTDDKKELRELKETMIWQTQRMEQAMKSQKKVTIVNNRVDTNWGSYIDKSVFK